MGWLIAIILGFLLLDARAELKRMRPRNADGRRPRIPADYSAGPMPLTAFEVQDLIVLRLELERLAAAGHDAADLCRAALANIDRLWKEKLDAAAEPEQPWRERKSAGWGVLARHGMAPRATPPWEPVVPPRPSSLSRPDLQAGMAGDEFEPEAELDLEKVELATQREPTDAAQAAAGQPDTRDGNTAPDATSCSPVAAEPPDRDGLSHAWAPSQPSALERALAAVSGWPRIFLPFLVQNVGWFVGVLCFVAGSVFLVAYTSGIAQSLTVFATVFAYTAGLLGAGYQLRLRRPGAETASSVLLVLGMLLVPLSVSAAVRLLVAGGDLWWLNVLGLVATGLALGAFYLAGQVVSGIADRALQGAHPKIFLLLSALQLAVPVLARRPEWPLLGFVHALLLGVLGFGLLRYTTTWMRSVFLEHRRIAYFAAGSLLYAGAVSFVHLTWGTAGSLTVPNGYYGPYLMAVSGLLFHVDARLKEWLKGSAFLSRFSFVVYSLSVLAVMVVLDAPVARALTLALAAFIYGYVVWHYLTLVPLYLLVASLGGLYGQLVLQPFPAEWHLLLSLPVLLPMFALSRRALGRNGQRPAVCKVARVTYRLGMALLVVTAVWSLHGAQPGLVPMASALAMAATVWWALRAAPARALEPTRDESALQDATNGPWMYGVTLAATLAVAYAPTWGGLAWETRFAIGLVCLAWTWTWFGLRSDRSEPAAQRARTEVLVNSALLSLGGGLAFGFVALLGGLLPVQLLSLLCAASAPPLLALSLGLKLRTLFYGFLIVAAGAGVLIKVAFFPGLTSGTILLLLGLGLWWFLWWLDRAPDELGVGRSAPLTLLGRLHSMDGEHRSAPHAKRSFASPQASDPANHPSTEGGSHV